MPLAARDASAMWCQSQLASRNVEMSQAKPQVGDSSDSVTRNQRYRQTLLLSIAEGPSASSSLSQKHAPVQCTEIREPNTIVDRISRNDLSMKGGREHEETHGFESRCVPAANWVATSDGTGALGVMRTAHRPPTENGSGQLTLSPGHHAHKADVAPCIGLKHPHVILHRGPAVPSCHQSVLPVEIVMAALE